MEAASGRAFLDLHCHSAASFDSLTSPADLTRVAAQRGLTHLAVTDHERIDGALRARDAAPDGLTVIIGEEVRSAEGDLIGLYLERSVPPGLSALETVAAIHEQGGLAGIPHPFDRFRASGLARLGGDAARRLAAALDYVEIHNARVPYPGANQRAADFAQRAGLPGVAVSDAHSLLEVGLAYVSLDAPVGDAAELRAALPGAQLVMGRASLLARGLTPAAKLVNRLRGNRRIRPLAEA
ncbi:MAG TPA: PHP domain-containing protein [Candidatus Limnocylindrales bacterium]|nr:PHP domain-containing protein [Candidatus Limnocylindrales bacterium]